MLRAIPAWRPVRRLLRARAIPWVAGLGVSECERSGGITVRLLGLTSARSPLQEPERRIAALSFTREEASSTSSLDLNPRSCMPSMISRISASDLSRRSLSMSMSRSVRDQSVWRWVSSSFTGTRVLLRAAPCHAEEDDAGRADI